MNVYIHIPFCRSKCAYCAFLSHCDLGKEDKYIDTVCTEISNFKELSNYTVNTIYFGGGTPSLIMSENIEIIIDKLRQKTAFSKNIEITLECNPEDISIGKLQNWSKLGINRLSIGVQSLNDSTRKSINRSLPASEVPSKISLAQKHFKNVGVDMISGLPEESAKTLLCAIDVLAKMKLSHISLYDLEIDNLSNIGINQSAYNLPDEESSATMLLQAWNLLGTYGYEQYEISNFAINNMYCRHNLDFWNGKDYIGFGLGASSRIGPTIATNTSNFSEYLSSINKIIKETMTESELDRIHLLTQMRLNKSFKVSYKKAFLKTIIPVELVNSGYISNDFRLTQIGKLLYNQVVNRLINSE